MNKSLLAGLLLIVSNTVFGQKTKDIQAIKSMLGCYNVEFKYTETFAPEVDYEKAYDYTSAAFEWAELVEETKDKIVIQHLLIINDSTVIKHWRQDWIYEADRAFTYEKDQTWLFADTEKDAVAGKWTQKVYQVDDSPRYSGTATWTHIDGYSSWYNKTDSPLPRREYSKRSDYNVMKRGNRVVINEQGWLHEQDNDKIIREDGKADLLLVQEKGYNTYEKRPDADCKQASDWWEENKAMWVDVRMVWDEVYSQNNELKLHEKVEDKRLYEHLFRNYDSWNKKTIESLVDQYIVKAN